MAYENRIYLVDVHREKDESSKSFGKVYYAEKIAMFDMACVGYSNGWKELFDKPIDYEIYAENGDESTCEDRYGEHLKSADFDKVINWLEKNGQKMDYRRIAPLLGMLKGFNRTQWDELQIVHYGY